MVPTRLYKPSLMTSASSLPTRTNASFLGHHRYADGADCRLHFNEDGSVIHNDARTLKVGTGECRLSYSAYRPLEP